MDNALRLVPLYNRNQALTVLCRWWSGAKPGTTTNEVPTERPPRSGMCAKLYTCVLEHVSSFCVDSIRGVQPVPLGLMNGARGIVVAILYSAPQTTKEPMATPWLELAIHLVSLRQALPAQRSPVGSTRAPYRISS